MKYKLGDILELKIDNIHVILEVVDIDINDADYIDGTILKDLNGLQEEMNIITVSHDHKKYLTILKAANILFKDNNEI